MTTIGGDSRWRPDFEQRIRVKTKFVINKVKKKRFPFICASTSLDTKH